MDPNRPSSAVMWAQRVRWDRVGRCSLLAVLALVAVLYIPPALSYFSTWRQSHAAQSDVRRLEAEHARLVARHKQLEDPAMLEAEARRLGMVRPDERSYVVRGLPR